MTFHISRRSLVRLVTFISAAIIALGFSVYSYSCQARSSRRALEYGYMKNISDLSTHIQNIDSDLSKIMLTGTPKMLSSISSKLWRESGFAKELISGLPVEYLKLQNTNKFLSQVGDYCVSISKEAADGGQISYDQRKNLQSLKGYSQTMVGEMLAINDEVQTGSLSLFDTSGNISRDFDENPAPDEIGESFTDFEEGFTAYPTLIYDGPFSDHIMQKEPQKVIGQSNITKAQAKSKAAQTLDIPESSLTEGYDEDSRLPSYSFNAGETDISVTKKGGYLSYMLKPRSVDRQELSADEAVSRAMEFLNRLGVTSMQSTYYEISNNALTVNTAYVQDGVMMYTDLIKVTVALDDGEILSFDARGFLVNSHDRELSVPALTAAQAQKSLNPELIAESSALCVIPSGGLNEVLCYEFKCRYEGDNQALIYINADTGEEEQILMLMISENGQLTI